MYGEETLKYISCLLKKGTKVCSFTFHILYAQKCINLLSQFINICAYLKISILFRLL